ncbi:unnamed protein product, partial [Adineta steineri]
LSPFSIAVSRTHTTVFELNINVLFGVNDATGKFKQDIVVLAHFDNRQHP